MTRYRTIVADPPWPIGDFPQWFASGNGGTVKRPYAVMTIDEIAALPVRELAPMRAHLYLWTITEHLWDAPKVARAWGFEPSALLTWCKPDRPGGLGGTFPSNTEFIVFCTRDWGSERSLIVTRWLNAALKRSTLRYSDVLAHFGFREGSGQVGHWTALTVGAQPAVPSVSQWEELRALLDLDDEMDGLVAELNVEKGTLTATGRAAGRWYPWPVAEHSRKPDAFLDLVEQVSPGPYLELFARRQRLGWDTWGNEALEHVNLGEPAA